MSNDAAGADWCQLRPTPTCGEDEKESDGNLSRSLPDLSQLWDRSPAAPAARLFRVFRAARDRLRPGHPARRHPRRIEAGPHAHVALRRPAAGRPGPGHPGRPSTRADPAGIRGRRWPRPSSASRGSAVGQGRLGQPDPLVQGPGRLGRAHRGPRARLHPLSPAPRPATWPTRSPPTPPGSACRRSCSSRPTSSRPRSSRPRSTAGTWSRVEGSYDDVNRLCSELTETDEFEKTGLRQRQRAARTTPRVRRRSATRWPSSSAGGSRPRW